MEDANFDIVYGNSGAIIVLINMYHLTNDIQYLESAIHAGELLIKAQIQYGEIKGGWISDGRQSPLAGLSHGISGMVLALVKLWDATKRDEFLNAAIVGIKYENSLFGKMKEFIRGKKLLIEVAIVLHGVMELPEFCLIE